MNKKRLTKGSDLEGNAWAFATLAEARAVYQTVLAQTRSLYRDHDWSLQTGFFAGTPFFLFLWEPNVHPEFVMSVERLAIRAGGDTLGHDTKTEMLRQARLRWRVMRKPHGGTVIKYHPQGKKWTDLRD